MLQVPSNQFAPTIAVGGMWGYLRHGAIDSLFVGWGGAAWLSICAMAMSDMQYEWLGHMGVKMAWGK